MNREAKNDDFIVWESLKKEGDGYYVEYTPARYSPKSKDYPLAHLIVTVTTKQLSKEEIAEILEKEFCLWIKKYPVPLFAGACDDKEDMVDISSVRTARHLTGYPQVTLPFMKWGYIENNEIPVPSTDKERLKSIYQEIPYRTESAIRTKVRNEAITRNIILSSIALMWILVPLAIELLGATSKIVGLLILAYSIFKAGQALLRLFGFIKPSKSHADKQEKERKMRHYYYHCEKNPDGFRRLMMENFEKEAQERTKKELQEIQQKAAAN